MAILASSRLGPAATLFLRRGFCSRGEDFLQRARIVGATSIMLHNSGTTRRASRSGARILHVLPRMPYGADTDGAWWPASPGLPGCRMRLRELGKPDPRRSRHRATRGPSNPREKSRVAGQLLRARRWLRRSGRSRSRMRSCAKSRRRSVSRRASRLFWVATPSTSETNSCSSFTRMQLPSTFASTKRSSRRTSAYESTSWCRGRAAPVSRSGTGYGVWVTNASRSNSAVTCLSRRTRSLETETSLPLSVSRRCSRSHCSANNVRVDSCPGWRSAGTSAAYTRARRG